MLQQEAKGQITDADPSGSSADVIWHVLHSSDPHAFYNTYNTFITWMNASLDSFKPELATLSFPVFAQFYCTLIRLDKTPEAKQFYTR